MKGAAADSAADSLLERDEELERLESTLKLALKGNGTLVLIEGSAGIGKTALLGLALRTAQAAGMTVASARGSELEREFAFGVIRQLLEPAVMRADPTERAELLAGAASLAGPLFSDAALADQDHGPAADHSFSRLHGLYWLCSNLAQANPLLLAVDDAHWADLASLRFLAYLGQRLEGLPLVVAVATRPPEAPAEEDLIGRLQRDPDALVLTPAPLSTHAVSNLLGETGRVPDFEFAEACHAATGGVPLLVRELIRALVEQGVKPVATSAARVEQTGPPTVARYVVARVRRITPQAEQIAGAIAVLGPDAELRRVTRLVDVDPEDALHALDALARAGVISSARPLEFAHPVVRAAIYNNLAPGERGRMHSRAAAMLAEERVGDERIASHLLAAMPSGDQSVVELLLRTARAALARGAPHSAAAYLERALAEPPDGESRWRLLHELGVAESHSGQAERARDHLREAYRLAEPGRNRAVIAQDLAGSVRVFGWRHGEAGEVIATALEQLDPGDRDLVLALSAELILLATLEPTVHAEAAPAPTTPTGESLGAAKYLAALTAEAAVGLRRPAAEARELAASAREAGIVEDLAHGGSLWINAVAPLVIADGFPLAERMLDEAFAAARRRASMIFTTRAYVTRSLLRYRQGALTDAQADSEAALGTAGDAPFYSVLLALSVLVEVACERGDPAAADRALEGLRMDGEIPDTFVHNWVLHSRGRLRLAQGRMDDAVRDLEELETRNQRRGQLNPAVHPYRSGLALALLRQGGTERACSLAAEELELARRWGAPRAIGISLRTLGLCDGGPGGLERLRQSVDVLAGSGAALEHARSLVELGAAIRRSGVRTEAREPLRAGMELAYRCGAPPLVDQAREELLATGARPRRIMRTGIDALTPSELRVARLAAEGLTNREIAQSLFVTQRTVEGHLTHAFQKLDIASRAELEGRLAAEPGD